jgi:hypothetical protein
MDVLIFPLLVVSHTIAVFGQKQCFLSDGTFVTNEVPCDPSAAVSACCYKLATASQIFTVGLAWVLTASLERALILHGKTLRVAVLVS